MTHTCWHRKGCCRLISEVPRALRVVLRLFLRLGFRRQPPRAGEHGVEVMQEAGFSEAEINKMVADGIVSVPAHQSPAAA